MRCHGQLDLYNLDKFAVFFEARLEKNKAKNGKSPLDYLSIRISDLVIVIEGVVSRLKDVKIVLFINSEIVYVFINLTFAFIFHMKCICHISTTSVTGYIS